MIRCLLRRSEPVRVIGQSIRWRYCPPSLHSALGHLVQAATERINGCGDPQFNGRSSEARIRQGRNSAIRRSGHAQRLRLVCGQCARSADMLGNRRWRGCREARAGMGVLSRGRLRGHRRPRWLAPREGVSAASAHRHVPGRAIRGIHRACGWPRSPCNSSMRWTRSSTGPSFSATLVKSRMYCWLAARLSGRSAAPAAVVVGDDRPQAPSPAMRHHRRWWPYLQPCRLRSPASQVVALSCSAAACRPDVHSAHPAS